MQILAAAGAALEDVASRLQTLASAAGEGVLAAAVALGMGSVAPPQIKHGRCSCVVPARGLASNYSASA